VTGEQGLKSAKEYPLWDAIFGRRSRRVAAGATFKSGSFSFESKLDPQPLSPLEEAFLIASTGITGLAFADNPYQTNEGKPLLGTPLIEAAGRAAGSPDNAQSTHFFMWNDEGTYLLKKPATPLKTDIRQLTAEDLIAHANACKVKVRDGRLDFPRAFPAYASGNRFVSNVSGSTMFVPVTEVTRQYINGLFYVLAQEDGQRPVFLDDFNLYLPCGCEKWIKSGFLNKKIPSPLSMYAKGRTEYESLLLLQNLALVAQSMGLGGWIHAAFAPAILLGGYPDIGPGLGFRFEKPKTLIPLPRPYPAAVENPVGLDGVLESYAPPYYKDTDAAIDAILAEKYGAGGMYATAVAAAPGMKPDSAAAFVREAPHVDPDVIDVVRAICRYIWKTYGRFPAHCHAIDASGVWMQCHHIDPAFYEQHFIEPYSPTQLAHHERWHK
jgi:hypothetical protein